MWDLRNSELAASDAKASVTPAETDEVGLTAGAALDVEAAHSFGGFGADEVEVLASSKDVHALAAYGYTAAERRSNVLSLDGHPPTSDVFGSPAYASERLQVAHASTTRAN